MSGDVYFTYALACVVAIAVLAYGVRLAAGATPRSERVEAVGGTVLLGKGLMSWSYWATDPLVRGLVAIGVTANALTWSALVFGLGAAAAAGAGWFGLACLLATISTVGDILDGQVARATRTGGNRGELLDAAVDRYTELAFVGGLIVYFHDSIPLVILALAAAQASIMVSYASAKAEALDVKPPSGLMRRHERGTYLIVGVGLASLLGDSTPIVISLAIVAAIGNVAAVIRFVRISRAL